MSRRTALCIVNSSGKDVTKIDATVLSPNGFEDPTGFKKFLDDSTIAKNDSLGFYVEISNSGPSDYQLTLTFDDGTSVTFQDDQQDAMVKHVGAITPAKPVNDLQVFRISGGDTGSTNHGTNGIYLRALPVPDNSDWMAELLARKPEVRLNDITMPGSHDAGMYKITGYLDPTSKHNPEFVQTQYQDFSFAKQLAAGSRYFDVRIRLNDDRVLCTSHWSSDDIHAGHYGAYGAILNEVLEDVVTFVRNHRDEVVILKFSHTDMVEEPQIIGPIVKRVKDIIGGAGLLYTNDSDSYAVLSEKLAHVKANGNVIAVFDKEFKPLWKPSEGIFPYFDVPKDGTNWGVGAVGAYVYDYYADKNSYEEMDADQLPKLANYGGWGNWYEFLLAWTLSGKLTKIMDIEVLAGMANPWLPSLMSQIAKNGTNRPGIVSLDFIDPYLCQAVIAVNKLTQVRQFSPAGSGEFNRGFWYGTGQNGPSGAWQFPRIEFYGFATYEQQGTRAVNQFHATNPNRYYYGMEGTSPYGDYQGAAFYAFEHPTPGTVPINRFYKDETDNNGKPMKAFWYSSLSTPFSPEWVLDGIAFYAYETPQALTSAGENAAAATASQGHD